MLLRSVTFHAPVGASRFPFTVPLVRLGATVSFDRPVTVLAGENGAGKSTLLEAVAVAADLPVAGGADVDRDTTLWAGRELSATLKLTWSARTRRGVFLRAEDFFAFAQRVDRMRTETEAALARIEREEGRGSLRAMPFARDRHELRSLYGEGLEAASHGEAFLAFFQSRLRPGGLYVLDEPEAALSPLRQLTLIALLKDAVASGAQVIMATHSPILLAFPGARLLRVGEDGAHATEWEDLEHVRLMRDFLRDPDAFLRHL